MKSSKQARAPKRRPSRPARAPKPTAGDVHRLMHELEVHQVELETQNEELRRARNDLELALAGANELFDFAPIGYTTLDDEHAIQNVNLVGAELLGRPRSRLIDARFEQLLARSSAPAFAALVVRVRETSQPASCELALATGPERAVLHVTATTRAAGSLLLAFENITERKIEQERLAETEQALRAANERKDDFIAMLSHELRNPLGPIHASLFVLESAEMGEAMWTEAKAILKRQAGHLTRLVDDLLDVTRLSRGKIPLLRERVDLVELVGRTLSDHRSGFEKAGVTLTFDGAHEPLWVDVDPVRIVQVVSNVLVNAQKFTPRGRVDVVVQRRDDHARLRVRDTGSGIAPELLPHVFEAFTQAPQSLDRGRGGLGLGLAMVKGLVTLHGGSVEITSDGLGRGTELTIMLPLESGPGVAAESARPQLAPCRVLVVEDQPDASRALQDTLTMLGLDVRVANDGPSAFEIGRAFHPEIVLCDIGLPGMDGHDVARGFRRDVVLRDAFLIALSGYARPEDVERASRAGFSRHLAKPATLDMLARVIAEARELAPAAPICTGPDATPVGRLAP